MKQLFRVLLLLPPLPVLRWAADPEPWYFAAAAAIWAWPAPAAEPPVRSKSPNVILIVSDDQGYADVGFHGSQEIKPPHLHARASSGTTGPAGHVTFPVGPPFRAGFLSGRSCAGFGYDTNPDSKTENFHAAGLPLPERTLTDSMGKLRSKMTTII